MIVEMGGRVQQRLSADDQPPSNQPCLKVLITSVNRQGPVSSSGGSHMQIRVPRMPIIIISEIQIHHHVILMDLVNPATIL